MVDVDLSKFFDRVHHGILIDRLQRRIAGAGVIRLVHAYLNAGIMDGGVVVERHLGTPQGGPLSPLLANVLLDEVDKALKARGSAGLAVHRPLGRRERSGSGSPNCSAALTSGPTTPAER